jgi:hypothetical protein
MLLLQNKHKQKKFMKINVFWEDVYSERSLQTFRRSMLLHHLQFSEDGGSRCLRECGKYQSVRCHIPKECSLRCHRRLDVKSLTDAFSF